VCASCPSHTNTTAAGATSLLTCACAPGYTCAYTKRLIVTVRLQNTTTFTAPVKASLIGWIAVAAGVPQSSVSILSPPTARRLLDTQIHFVVLGVESIHLERAHSRRSLHTDFAVHSITWVPAHSLSAAASRRGGFF